MVVADAVRGLLFAEPTDPALTRERYEVLERRVFWRLGVPAALALGVVWRLWRGARPLACLSPLVGLCVAYSPRARPGDFDDIDARAAAFANAFACVTFFFAVACDASLGALPTLGFLFAKPWTWDPPSLAAPVAALALVAVLSFVQCAAVVSAAPLAHLALRRPTREVLRATAMFALMVAARAVS